MSREAVGTRERCPTCGNPDVSIKDGVLMQHGRSIPMERRTTGEPSNEPCPGSGWEPDRDM